MDSLEVRPANFRRKPLHPDITEEAIRQLVDAFYAKVRKDQRLGPIFNGTIGDKWDVHLPKMYDFWSSVTRMTGRYKGKPMVQHMKLKQVEQGDFDIWLSLFRETARDLFADEVANIFIARAEMIAKSLQLGMCYLPVEKPQ